MDRAALEALGREDLVVEARSFGVKRPEVMTRVELVDEVLRLATPNPVERKEIRGWLGVARDLLASAVERGLNLPDAAAMIRGDVRFVPMHPVQPPVATVTLAEIYGAQGHFDRALGMLDEVLDREADHEVARRLRTRLITERDVKRAKDRERSVETPAPSVGESALSMPPAESAPAESGVARDERPEPTALPPAEEPSEEHDTEVGDEPEPATLPPVPDPETLPPIRDLLTLAPAPDLPTLPPAPDLATLMPARPDIAVLGYDELEQETLIPSEAFASSESETAGAPAPASEVAASSDEPAGDALAEEPSDAAVVFARTGAGTASVYFELGRLVAMDGQVLVLRVVEHRSRATSVERVERDLPVTERRGTATIADLERGSVLRAALGSKWDGEFRAAAVGAEVRVATDGVDVAWAPRHGVDYAAVAGRSGLGVHVVV